MRKHIPFVMVLTGLALLLLAACQPSGQSAVMEAIQTPAGLPGNQPAYPPPSTPTLAASTNLAAPPTPADTPAGPQETGPYPAPPLAGELATPVSDSPAAGICDLVEGDLVTFEINPDIPSPRCAQALPEQRLKVINRTAGDLEVSIGGFETSLAPAEETIFEAPLGDYLLPGVHQVMTSAYSGGGPELWLLEAPLIGTPGYPGP